MFYKVFVFECYDYLPIDCYFYLSSVYKCCDLSLIKFLQLDNVPKISIVTVTICLRENVHTLIICLRSA